MSFVPCFALFEKNCFPLTARQMYVSLLEGNGEVVSSWDESNRSSDDLLALSSGELHVYSDHLW